MIRKYFQCACLVDPSLTLNCQHIFGSSAGFMKYAFRLMAIFIGVFGVVNSSSAESEVVWIDVRTPEEHATKSIDGCGILGELTGLVQ